MEIAVQTFYQEQMKYPDDIDAECVPLCDALNALPGIRTSSSCCGHGEHPHRIFFGAETIDSLLPIVLAADSSAWHVEADNAVGPGFEDVVIFKLEGPKGPANIPGGADDFASWLTHTSTVGESLR